MTRRLAYPALLVACFVYGYAVVPAARADFRTDNYWMSTSTYAQHKLTGGYRIRGEGAGYRYLRVIYAKCRGDSSGDYPIDRAKGFYHHLHCGVVLTNRHVFALDYWAVGQTNYRVTDIRYVPTP